MLKKTVKEFDHLSRSLVRMAGLVEEALATATTALFERDREAARRVIAGDDAVDALENEVQEECLRVLALHAPLAGDLRWVAAVLLAATDLERVGDLAAGIAGRVHALTLFPPIPIPAGLPEMAARAGGMLREAVDAFVQRDRAAALRVVAADDEVDRANAALIRELVGTMTADPAAVEPGLGLFTVVRHLEKAADHAVSLAEEAVYVADGALIRHAHRTPAPAANPG